MFGVMVTAVKRDKKKQQHTERRNKATYNIVCAYDEVNSVWNGYIR
jgi:hypothetical protein